MGFHTSPLIGLFVGHKKWEIDALDFTDKAEKADQHDYATD